MKTTKSDVACSQNNVLSELKGDRETLRRLHVIGMLARIRKVSAWRQTNASVVTGMLSQPQQILYSIRAAYPTAK